MSVYDAAQLATSLIGDKFDGAIAVIEFYRDQVAEMDIPCELHPGDGTIPEGWGEASADEHAARTLAEQILGKPASTDDADAGLHTKPHFFDRKADLLARFNEAIRLVREADRMNMAAVADIP